MIQKIAATISSRAMMKKRIQRRTSMQRTPGELWPADAPWAVARFYAHVSSLESAG